MNIENEIITQSVLLGLQSYLLEKRPTGLIDNIYYCILNGLLRDYPDEKIAFLARYKVEYIQKVTKEILLILSDYYKQDVTRENFKDVFKRSLRKYKELLKNG